MNLLSLSCKTTYRFWWNGTCLCLFLHKQIIWSLGVAIRRRLITRTYRKIIKSRHHFLKIDIIMLTDDINGSQLFANSQILRIRFAAYGRMNLCCFLVLLLYFVSKILKVNSKFINIFFTQFRDLLLSTCCLLFIKKQTNK